MEPQLGRQKQVERKENSMKNNKSQNKKGKEDNGRRNGGNKSYRNSASRYSNNKRPKETELNIPTKSLNAADLKILSAKNHANNDEAWYNKLGQIYTDATNIPFNVLSGLPFNPIKTGGTVGNSTFGYTNPGIMSIRLAPTVGVSLDINSPINIAAQQLFVDITKANNRNKQYDKTDVIMQIVAMDSCYMLYEFLDRAYRGFGNISNSNRYYPMFLLQAMKMDTESLQTSLEAFRSTLNLFAYRLSSINVPDVFSFVARHSWLFSHVYKDADTDKAQAYMYMPDGFYQWMEGPDVEKNYLRYVSFEELFGLDANTKFIGINQIRKAISQLIDPILGSSSVGLISSDIAKAYSDSGMIRISQLTENETLEPQYDELVLMQMSNLTQLEGVANMDITQELSDLVAGPYLVHQPWMSYRANNYAPRFIKHYLNVRGNAPSNKDIAESTRLTASVGGPVSDDPQAASVILSCGTELVTGISTYILRYQSVNSPAILTEEAFHQTGYLDGTNNNSIAVSPVTTLLRQIHTASAFDWAPTQYLVVADRDATTFVGVVQDLDNYTYLSEDQIKGMNDAIVMSEFKVD